MNTSAIIGILNKEFDANISTKYYEQIEEWRQWWKGYLKSFHAYLETSDNGDKKEHHLFAMRMAKRVCEDWAGFLLNEKTKISIEDKPSSEWLQGKDGLSGVIGNMNFWQEANALVEKAFYSGTGAFVLRMDGIMQGADGAALESPEATVDMEFLPATCIFPLTLRYGQITEVAFASERTMRGKDFVYLEVHTFEQSGYVIRNRYFQDNHGALTEAPLPDDMVSEFSTGSPYPLFSIIKPNAVSQHDKYSGLGSSIFSNAIDNLKGIDLAYNNFNRDLWLGGKKVIYSRELTRVVGLDDNGNPIYAVPDERLQQLFICGGDSFEDGKSLIYEYNPSLRVQENRDAVQAQLDYLSFKCGMGSRHYRFDGSGTGVVTATQYTGEKQELKQSAAKHSIIIEKALQDIVRAILWAGKYLLGQPVDPETKIEVKFSDGYIVSDEERKADDRQDLMNGVLLPWEYRMRQYGEDEETAKAVLAVGREGMTFGNENFNSGDDV